MTTNAYLFMWDVMGIDSIVPITQYEEINVQNTFNILANRPVERNPLTSIIQNLILRAKCNPQRSYEIYAIDCDSSITYDKWQELWEDNPQECANLIRENGHKLYSDYNKYSNQQVIQ